MTTTPATATWMVGIRAKMTASMPVLLPPRGGRLRGDAREAALGLDQTGQAVVGGELGAAPGPGLVATAVDHPAPHGARLEDVDAAVPGGTVIARMSLRPRERARQPHDGHPTRGGEEHPAAAGQRAGSAKGHVGHGLMMQDGHTEDRR